MSERARLAEPDLGKAVNAEVLRPRLPARPKVLRIEAHSYVDHTDEDAILVQVVLANDTTDEEIESDNLDKIEEVIRESLRDDDRFPYIRFATRKELEELDKDDSTDDEAESI